MSAAAGLGAPVLFDLALASGKYTAESRNNAVNVTGTLSLSDRFSRLAWAGGGGTMSSWLDAVQDLNAASFSTTGSGHNSFLLGTSHLGTNYFKGPVCEVAIYSAALTGTDVANYLTYSLAKWGALGSPIVMSTSGNSADSNSTNATNTIAGTPATNDVIVAHVTVSGASSSVITPPAGEGWALIVRSDDAPTGSGTSAAVYWKRWGTGSTDNTSVAFTGTVGNMRLALTRLRGCKTSGNPFTASAATTNNGSVTTVTAPTATGAAQQRTLRFYSVSANTVALTPAAGVNAGGVLYTSAFTAGVDGASAATESTTDANPTGTASATASATTANGSCAITVTFTAV